MNAIVSRLTQLHCNTHSLLEATKKRAVKTDTMRVAKVVFTR
jgi:hypothetical protein